jgi:retron-type reverse transcriptase
LSIPTVRDRVVMAAAKIVLEPIFEADFLPSSFGFRPKRSAHHALEAVRVAVNRGAVWVLDADIKACFSEIDHEALVAQVERGVVDRQMVKLLRSWLRAGVFEGGVVSQVEAGTPQGSLCSAEHNDPYE